MLTEKIKREQYEVVKVQPSFNEKNSMQNTNITNFIHAL